MLLAVWLARLLLGLGSGIDSTSPSVLHSSSAKLPLPFHLLSLFIYEAARQRQIKNTTNTVHRFSSVAFFLSFFVFHFGCCTSRGHFHSTLFDGGWNFWVKLNWMQMQVVSLPHSFQPPSIESIFQQTIYYHNSHLVLFTENKINKTFDLVSRWFTFWFPLCTILCLHCVLENTLYYHCKQVIIICVSPVAPAA